MKNGFRFFIIDMSTAAAAIVAVTYNESYLIDFSSKLCTYI